MKNPVRLILLLIPSIIFVGVLYLYFTNSQSSNIASDTISTIRSETSNIVKSSTPTPIPYTTVVIAEDVSVKAQVANTPDLRRIGLSETTNLAENEGMLFDFNFKEGDNRKPSFWMKDMTIPIDIIWISEGKISQIDANIAPPEENTPDSQLKLYLPDNPIDYVLEVNAGFSENNDLQVGDSVDF